MKPSFQRMSAPPYLFNTPSLSRGAVYTLCALLPHIIMLILLRDFSAVSVIGISVIGCIAAELIDNKIRKRITLSDGSVFITGILMGMFFPSGLPLWTAFCISFGSVVLTKSLFGGLGCSWVNPAVVGAVVAFLCLPLLFPGYMVTKTALAEAGSPLSVFLSGSFSSTVPDASITGNINSFFLQKLGINLPQGYVTLFWDTGSLIPAFRFNLLTLAASIVLISAGVMGWVVPLCFFAVYLLFVWCFSLLPAGAGFWAGDMLFALLTGGSLFCGFFALQYHGTLPLSKAGKVCYGVLAGIIAFFICGVGGTPAGIFFTVLVVNCVSPLIQVGEKKLFALIKDREIKQRAKYGK